MKKGVIVLAMCTVMGFILPSCEKEGYDISPQMESFYMESVQLPTVSLDSIMKFSTKVDSYVADNPLAKEHRRYPQILQNIKTASLRLSISINDEWDGDTHINYLC